MKTISFAQMDDEVSETSTVTFSMEAGLLEKLNIPKRMDLRTDLDHEKLYRYQLERDKAKIEAKKGTYAERNSKYIKTREAVPEYQAISKYVKFGENGETEQVAEMTHEISWKETRNPYGPVAHRRHLEWLAAHKPIGPTEEELNAAKQVKQDIELWRNIRYGRTERQIRKAPLTTEQIEALDAVARKRFEEEKEEEIRLKDPKGYNIVRYNFGLNRTKPTMLQYEAAMHNWDRGHHPDFNFDHGTPGVTKLELEKAAKDRATEPKAAREDMTKPVDTSKFIGPHGSLALAYNADLVQRSMAKSIQYVKEVEEELRRRELRAKQKAMEREKNRGTSLASSSSGSKSRRSNMTKRSNVQEFATSSSATSVPTLDLHQTTQKTSSSPKLSSPSSDRKKPKNPASKKRSKDSELENNNPKSPQKEGVNNILSNSGKLLIGSAMESSLMEEEELAVLHPLERNDGTNHASNELLDGSRVHFNEDDSNDDSDGSVELELSLEPQNALGFGRSSVFLDDSPRDNRFLKKQEDSRLLQQIDSFADAVGNLFARVGRGLRTLVGLSPQVEPEFHGLEETSLDEDEIANQMDADEIQRIEEQIEKMEEELAMDKLMGVKDDRNLKKRKLKKLRQRLEQRVKVAEEMKQMREDKKRRLQLEAELLEAEKRMEAAKTRFNLVAQLQENIRMAHKLGSQMVSSASEALNPLTKLMKKGTSSALFLDTLIAARAAKRTADRKFQERFDAFFGIYRAEEYTTYPADLVVAANRGDVNGVIDLLDHDVDPVSPNAMNSEGVSATYKVLAMLLRQEAINDSEQTKKGSFSKRMLRCFKKDDDFVPNLPLVLQLLLHKGGDVNLRKNDQENEDEGYAVIHYAAEIGAVKFIEFLVSLEADVCVPSLKQQKTPLMCAVEKNQLSAALCLIQLGAIDSINVPDARGWTVMHYAAAFASCLMVQALLFCGAKYHFRNKAGFSPMDEGSSRGQFANVELLRTFREVTNEARDKMDFFKKHYADWKPKENSYLFARNRQKVLRRKKRARAKQLRERRASHDLRHMNEEGDEEYDIYAEESDSEEYNSEPEDGEGLEAKLAHEVEEADVRPRFEVAEDLN